MTEPDASPLAVPPLDGAALGALLPARWTPAVVAETGSTNADVREAALAGSAGPGHVLLAEHQHAGRGRLGRSWASRPRTGLTFSVLLSPTGVPDGRWGWLPLLAGLAVADGAGAVAGVPLRLKWPNDVLAADGRKVAGLLAERVDLPGGPAAVIGIGLNVGAGLADLPVPTATSLALAGGADLDRARLLAAVLDALAARFDPWVAAAGDAAACGLAAAYRAASATLGAEVSVELPGGAVLAGRAEGLDGAGALLVGEAGGGLRSVAAGDVTHVR